MNECHRQANEQGAKYEAGTIPKREGEERGGSERGLLADLSRLVGFQAAIAICDIVQSQDTFEEGAKGGRCRDSNYPLPLSRRAHWRVMHKAYVRREGEGCENE